MNKPTGKLAMAYRTIANMEAKIAELVSASQASLELVGIVTAERDALAAQVELLKKIAYTADGARQSNSEGNYGDEKEWLRHLYNSVGEYDCTATPQHHLAAHDAEVVNNLAIYICDRAFKGQLSKSEIIHYASEYAAQLRAKAGAE